MHPRLVSRHKRARARTHRGWQPFSAPRTQHTTQRRLPRSGRTSIASMAPMAADVEQNTEDMPSGGMQQAGAMRLEELPCHIARRYWLRSRAERRAESEQDLPAAAAHCVVFPPCCGMRCNPRARLHSSARPDGGRPHARTAHACARGQYQVLVSYYATCQADAPPVRLHGWLTPQGRSALCCWLGGSGALGSSGGVTGHG